MLRSRKACWMAERSISKRLFYTTAGVAGFGSAEVQQSPLEAASFRSVLVPEAKRRTYAFGFRNASGLLPANLRDTTLILEWVESLHIKPPEISFIPGRNNQAVDPCRSGNHSVLQQLRGLAAHDGAPFPKTQRIHRKNLIRGS